MYETIQQLNCSPHRINHYALSATKHIQLEAVLTTVKKETSWLFMWMGPVSTMALPTQKLGE